MKIQELVLNEIFLSGKEVSVKELVLHTGLKISQIHNALTDLLHRGLIRKRRILNEPGGYSIPPVKEILVKVNDNTPFQYKRLLGVIKNARGREYAYS